MSIRNLLEILGFFLFLALLGALFHLNAPWWVFAIALLHGVVSYWEGFSNQTTS